jgi:hypothetical protein
VQEDTRTPPLLNAIYEQITRGAAGYDDLVDGSDISYDYVEDQVTTDGSLRYPDLARDEIPEGYRLRLQNIYTQFVDSQDCFREQLKLTHAHQRELHADLLAAEHERERLVTALGKSDMKRQGAKARCAEAEVVVSKLRADLTAVMGRLDRQTEVASSKDHIIQSVTEESQVAHVRLKYAEDKITHLIAKVQRERDRRLRKTKELLDEQLRVQDRHESEIHRFRQEAHDAQARVQDSHESEIHRLRQDAQDAQVRVQDSHESEIHRLRQEAQDAQEQLDTLRGAMSQLHADGRSPLDHDHSARYRQPTTPPYDTCQPPLPPERIRDAGTPPISPATNVSTKPSPYSHSQNQEGASTHRDPISEVTQDHRAALKKLFERMRQGEFESAQDAVKPNSEQQESRLQDELAVTKEQLCLAEEEVLIMRRDLDQSREVLQEMKTHVASLRSEWEMCKAMLRESQDARRSNMIELAEMAVTKEQLCLAEEEVFTMRRDLDQSREVLQEMKTHIASLRSEWKMCKAMLREAQDARRSNITELAEMSATKEQLCLAEEEVLTMRRDLDQSREALQEVNSHVASLRSEWEMCKAMLREAQDARRSNTTELAEMAATKEQLCLAEEEVLTLRRDLDQSREALQEVNSHVASLRSEWEMCKAMLREAQDARRSNMTEHAEVIELLRASQAEWEESQFRCSQVTLLCTALQERVTELEAKVKKLKYPAITPIHTDSESRSCCPTGTGTGMCAHPIYTPS